MDCHKDQPVLVLSASSLHTPDFLSVFVQQCTALFFPNQITSARNLFSGKKLTRFLMLSNLAASLASFSCCSLMAAISLSSSLFPPSLVGDSWDKVSLK